MTSPATDQQAPPHAPRPPRTREEAGRRESRLQPCEAEPAPKPVITDWANSARIVPGAASAGLVAPITSRFFFAQTEIVG